MKPSTRNEAKGAFEILRKHAMTTKGIIPLAIAAALACSHGRAQRGASTVAEADAGRIGPEQGALVHQARQELAQATDAVSRATLALQQAQNEQGIAKADQQAAGADQKVADAQQKVANDSRAPEALEKARQLQEQAKAHKQAADSHAEYAAKLIDLRKAELQAAERQVKVAEARVEWAKLKSLEQAGNPAATKYDPGRFQTAVNDAQAELDKASQNAKTLEAQATQARQRWADSDCRLQGDSGQTGTGSGR